MSFFPTQTRLLVVFGSLPTCKRGMHPYIEYMCFSDQDCINLSYIIVSFGIAFHCLSNPTSYTTPCPSDPVMKFDEIYSPVPNYASPANK